MWVRTCRRSIRLSIVIAALLQGACSGVGNTSASPPVASVADRDAWIVLADGSWVPVRDSFTTQLQRAYNAFQSGRFRSAANGFREAAVSLRDDQRGLSVFDRERLEEAASELDRLAGLAERGDLRRPGAADPILSRVCEMDAANRWPYAPIEAWLPLAGKPEEHFRRSEESIDRGNFSQAAAEIGKAVGFMRLEAGRSTLEGRMLINQSIHSLNDPERQLENRHLVDAATLDWIFGRAEETLARAHQLNAVEAWAKQRADLTGAELQSAAINLEDSAARFGRSDQFQTFAQTRITARELMSGKDYDPISVERTLAIIASQTRRAAGTAQPVADHQP